MGKLIEGQWVVSPEKTRTNDKGAFVRGTTKFRETIRADGSGPHPAEAGRYHLWVAKSCPWAHRTLITRRLKGLESAIGMTVANLRRSDEGWWFESGLDTIEPVDGTLPLHRLYSLARADYTGSATVPVLWDRQAQTIVNNESAEIVRMLNREMNAFGRAEVDLYPADLATEIDQVNEWVYSEINNGVYRCGFARTQEAYDEAFDRLFAAMDRAEARLDRHRYLAGDRLTEADVRIFPTLARFDAVYYGHFKCNLRRVVDYPNLYQYFLDLYQTPGFGETVDVETYKKGYMGRSPGLNPRGIIPKGPAQDFGAGHDRGRRSYGGG